MTKRPYTYAQLKEAARLVQEEPLYVVADMMGRRSSGLARALRQHTGMSATEHRWAVLAPKLDAALASGESLRRWCARHGVSPKSATKYAHARGWTCVAKQWVRA